MEDELQASRNALEDLYVHPDDFGVYAGDIEVHVDEDELDDSEQGEDMYDSEPEQANNEHFHGDNEQEQASNEQFHGDNEQEQGNNEQAQGNKYKNLTEAQRSGICTELLARSVMNRQRQLTLPKNATREVANMFHVSLYKVRRVWRRVKECHRLGIPVDVRSRKPQNCGRKRIEVDLSTVPDIPRSQRRTIRSLARALGVKKSTLHKVFTEGMLDRHSSSLKPYLRAANKKARLQFCTSMFDPQSLQDRPTFKDMRNIIHLDEKWFNTTQKTMKFYKLPSEPEPNRTVQNKNSIGKIMFLVLLARPRYNAEGVCIFDGKIGIWPFIKKVIT
jgi:DNA-binding TFAR19-related protein (PDSD5 family)